MAISNTSSISGANAASAAASTTAISNDDNSQQRFLTLLVTQLNNQDPTNPMDNAQLTSQLAQMSTVTGIQQLNTTLSGLVSQTGSSQALQAASLVGTSVLAPGNDLVAGSGTAGFALDMPSSAATVTVTIKDSAGNTVRTLNLGSMAAGVNGATWDGNDDAGNSVAAGTYQYSVAAANGGTAVNATALAFARVAAVQQSTSGSGVTLELASGRSIGLSDVRMYM
jgi:flagellar basal-body rod modification protein FlgD